MSTRTDLILERSEAGLSCHFAPWEHSSMPKTTTLNFLGYSYELSLEGSGCISEGSGSISQRDRSISPEVSGNNWNKF